MVHSYTFAISSVLETTLGIKSIANSLKSNVLINFSFFALLALNHIPLTSLSGSLKHFVPGLAFPLVKKPYTLANKTHLQALPAISNGFSARS